MRVQMISTLCALGLASSAAQAGLIDFFKGKSGSKATSAVREASQIWLKENVHFTAFTLTKSIQVQAGITYENNRDHVLAATDVVNTRMQKGFSGGEATFAKKLAAAKTKDLAGLCDGLNSEQYQRYFQATLTALAAAIDQKTTAKDGEGLSDVQKELASTLETTLKPDQPVDYTYTVSQLSDDDATYLIKVFNSPDFAAFMKASKASGKDLEKLVGKVAGAMASDMDLIGYIVGDRENP